MALTQITKSGITADAVDATKIADNAVDSEHYTDGSIDNAHIADDAIDSEHYADGSIDNAHIADDAIDSEHYAAGSIDTAHYAAGSVDATALGADAVTAAKIGDDIINSEHYVAASIDNEHLADDAVGVAELSATGTASSSTFLRGDNAWAAAGGGKIIGYQYSTDTTNRSGTAGSEAVTGLTFAYTPSATSSRLFISMSVPTLTLGVSVSAVRVFFRVKTGTTTGGTELTDSGYGSYINAVHVLEFDALQTYTFIHHPNSTSEVDYCLTVENASGAPTWKVSGCDNGWTTTISILEIDGS